ncbi:glycosyltransferase family 4 protein (plasmid) [Falsihalocynthiibacter sp. SS001]|uniref:glycosyltransferase family 4 protein n=1 Tax=Falsihalocynthiibacter sp. SS001 TaxID=3349698 RepID=UPI0036D2EEAC
MKTSKTCIICGPIAPRHGISRGGYETANRRTITLLEGAGWSVTEIPYPDTLGKSFLGRVRAYLAGFISIYLGLSPQANVPFHFTPLFKHFILAEYLLLRRAKSRGYRVILDLRAGNKARDRARRGGIYRYLFDKAVKLAGSVSVEGQEYLTLVRNISPNKPLEYLPNFVDTSFIAPSPPPRNKPRLIFVGTVSPAKGVPNAIALADRLADKGFQLDIVGRPIKEYTQAFDNNIKKRIYVHAHGPQNFETVRELLDASTFFIYLTNWAGEGQSNALTEAMARGCIPVVTDHGFNAATVGECGVVVRDREDIESIAASILELDQHNQSQAALSRVKTQFSAAHALEVLERLYVPTTTAPKASIQRPQFLESEPNPP